MAAEDDLLERSEPLRAVEDGATSKLEPSAAAVGGLGAISDFPASAAYSPCDYSGTSSPGAR
jgi:hypothetical protein